MGANRSRSTDPPGIEPGAAPSVDTDGPTLDHQRMPDDAVTPAQRLTAPAKQDIFTTQYAVRGDYQRVDTKLTLREGLAEYYRVNPGLSDPATLEHAPSARFFHNHDTTHVVFGTHTGPLDEGVNDMFTMFGVDISFIGYVRAFAATTEAKAVAKEYTGVSLLTLVIGSLRLLPRIRRTCKAMTAKWPWDPMEGDLDRPIVELREQYGIEVWRPEEALGMTPESQ
jgi:hypothetical protein